MSQYSRSGRIRPQGGGFELGVWYLMRMTGVGLFVLALTHFLILHVLSDPANQTSSWIAEVRWSSLFWRVFDWTLLMLVLFHGFMGMRTVVQDYVKGGARTLLLMGLYLLAILLFTMGTAVVLTLESPVPGT
jgi:succinate dehydrogenase / fumarate reductase membrane anchor subunit